MCTYVHSRKHPLQSQPLTETTVKILWSLKASWRLLSVIASILITDRISPALLLTRHDQDLDIYILILWRSLQLGSITSCTHPSCERFWLWPTRICLADDSGQSCYHQSQTRHSLLSWHLKTCWWLMIGLHTATITVGLIPDLSTVEWVIKDKQRLTYQAKWLFCGL